MAKRLTSQLFISRLSSYTTNQKLKSLFSPFGVVTEARLIIDSKTQRPKGFGFVSFESEIDAQKALKAMDGRKLRFMYEDWVKVSIVWTQSTVPNKRTGALMKVSTCFKVEIVDGRLIFVEVAKTERPGEDASS